MMRRLPGLLLAVALVASACTGGAGPEASPRRTGPPPAPGELQRVACALPDRVLRRIWNGTHPERSGEIQMVLKRDITFAYAHAGPWGFLQRVPLLLYGPDHVPAAGRVARSVTLADVAPTLAAHLRFNFPAPDGAPLREALPRGSGRAPKLVLVVVWDGGGRNVLAEWPQAWPTVAGLIEDGVWYERASIETSPSITPPVHSTLGTGAFPRRHGLISLEVRAEDGRLVPANARGPQYLLEPTLADLYDRARGNRPEVGVVAFRDWHLGMIGHGSYLEGGDADLAVLLDEPSGRWALPGDNARYYEFPDYVNEVPGLEEASRRLDLEDGRADQRWLGEDVFTDTVLLGYTPAYVEWQTAVLRELIRREGFGADAVPDLLYTNYKQIDEVGHSWRLSSPQMEAAVRASDRAIAELVTVLDEEVGRGEWVLVLTADHGVVPDRDRDPGTLLRKGDFQSDLREAFDVDDDGRDVLQKFRPTELWLDVDELRENGHSLRDVAAFLLRYRKEDNVADVEQLRPGERGERVFRAAFPTALLRDLPCLRRATGAGD